ncbi:hypothetical protein ACQUFY_00170 [Robbsia andropogonis]|uniref:hypothetical protein n=1 Tax=Robbsia andropogonis TaxID=28092 RepID=UPI003D1EE858
MPSRARFFLSSTSLVPFEDAYRQKNTVCIQHPFWLIATAFVAAMGVSMTAHAGTIFQSVNTQLTASAGGQYTNYRESSNNQTLDTETGFQSAYQGKLSIQRDMAGIKDVYLSASFAYSKGRTDYDGHLNSASGASIPYQAGTRVNSTDVTVKVGKAFPVTNQGQVIYYVYYGYHQWLRDSTIYYGYDEHYSHHSAGLGMIGQYAITPKLVFSGEASVGGTFAASMKTDITQGKFRLGSDLTVMGSLGLDYAVAQHLHVNAAYQISHFKYGQSGTVDYFYYEPSSTTTNQTLQVGMGLSF